MSPYWLLEYYFEASSLGITAVVILGFQEPEVIIFEEDNRDSSYLRPLTCTPPPSEDRTRLAICIFKKNNNEEQQKKKQRKK